MIEDYFKIAFRSLRERKVRSFLTIVGILIAVFTIFVLLSMSVGLSEAVNEQFELLGTDKFYIQPKGQSGLGAGGAVELTESDVNVVEKVNGVKQVTYMNIGNVKIEYKDRFRYYIVIGIPTENPDDLELVFEASDIGIDEGRFLKDTDKKKVMLGSRYKYDNLFGKPVRTGDKVELNDVEYEVIAIVEPIGNPQDDQQVYISMDDFKELFDSGERVDFIYVQVKEGEDLGEVADKVEKKLMKFRDVDEKTIDFSILTPEELLAIFGNILNILTAFLVGIGLISVVVGGIGIANTMYTSVLERNKEIGTMKAIGARNSDILLIFVIEAGILGLFGGLLGLGLGIIAAKTIEYIAVQYAGDIFRASLNPIIIIGSLGFAFMVGLASGFLPSYQASKLKPVDALRYE